MLVGAGVGVGVGSDVGVGDGVRVCVTVETGVVVGSRAAVGAGVCVGVSATAWVAADCAPVVGSGVAARAPVSVGVAGTTVATTGDVCSPPQAARAVTADRNNSSTGAAIPAPIDRPNNDFMAPFSASSTVESMIRPVYLPASDSTPPVPAAGCAPWKPQWQKPPPGREGPSHTPADGGVIALRKQPVCLRSLTVGRRVRSAHRVTSGGQKTDCASQMQTLRLRRRPRGT